MFSSPFGIGTHPAGGGINALTVAESSARSRYNGLTLGLRGRGAVRNRPLTFETHYTLAFDRSDDDNERDPFVLRYADAGNLGPEYGWSDRDRRHQVSGYLLATLPGEVQLNNVVRYLSASPVSEQCANRGMRAAQPSDRICADGTILTRNTLRRDNAFFTWDMRVSRRFALRNGTVIEPILEVFNLTNADNFVDTAVGSLLFNFDGTLWSGLGDTRRAGRWGSACGSDGTPGGQVTAGGSTRSCRWTACEPLFVFETRCQCLVEVNPRPSHGEGWLLEGRRALAAGLRSGEAGAKRAIEHARQRDRLVVSAGFEFDHQVVVDSHGGTHEAIVASVADFPLFNYANVH